MQNIFIELLPPWVETGLQPAFYDKESGTVLQQVSRMWAKMIQLGQAFNTFSENTTTFVNQFVDDTNDTIDDYIDRFNSLHDYVHDYFDNLDVQEEVNNKLDQMVEDGTLDVLIQHILDMETVTVFDTLEDVKNASAINSAVVETMGFYAKGDGGGARYYIADSGTADNIFVHALSNGKYAVLANQKEFNILQIGCKRNTSFDNASILSTIFKGGYSNTTVYVPDGVYETTRINYLGDNETTNGFKLIGVGKPVFKLVHSNKVATLKGSYNEAYTVSYGFDELDLVGHCTVNTLAMADGTTLFYLAVDNASLIPSSLTADMVIKGKTSGLEAYIASIDTADPDGEGTARIYLYEAHNERNRSLNFSVSGTSLSEQLIVKNHLGNDYLYIRFNDNVVPSYIAVGNQIKQGDKTARVNKIDITYENIHYIELTCMPEVSTFTAETLYFTSSTPFDVYSYTGYTAGMLSLNKYKNSLIKGIVFDGGNLEVSVYEANNNSWNTIITGGCKNITISECEFINSIMGGVQIGGMANVNAPARHDYPENFNLEKCYFYNNGRGDIEVIYGRHINIENCNGNGVLDIETNGSEILDNISISKCNFSYFTPYTPASSTNSTTINVSDCVFNTLQCQQKIVLNLSNVRAHYLQPQSCLIKGVNCYFDMMNGLHGNEHMFFTNTSFYGLYKNAPGGQFGNEYIELNECIIDLSASSVSPRDNIYSVRKHFGVNNSYIVSSTTYKYIYDVGSTYFMNNTTFHKVGIQGGGAYEEAKYKSWFINCKFLAEDNTTIAPNSDQCFKGSPNSATFEGCYFESHPTFEYSRVRHFNSILNTTTKPHLQAINGLTVAGAKSNDQAGISWTWFRSGKNGSTSSFSDVEFSPSINSSTLGTVGSTVAISTSNLADGCTGYYVGSTTHALVQMYHNNGSLATRFIDFS